MGPTVKTISRAEFPFSPWLKAAALTGVLAGAASSAWAAKSTVSQFESQDYEITTTTQSWAEPPGNHHRLYLDVYNVTDFFDAETGGDVGFADHTVLADTLRPTATLLWNDRFRIQMGAIGLLSYGSEPEFESVHAWLQLLWKPTKPLSVVLGNLDTPHYYFPALFYPTNYFAQSSDPRNLPAIPQLRFIPSNYFTLSPTEKGTQLMLHNDYTYDDLFFNYIEQDTAQHNEKFALGFVHENQLGRWFRLHYQAHWLHYGGQFNPHDVETRNDVAQAGGLGVYGHPFNSPQFILGGRYTYMHSHLRQEAADPANTIDSFNGHGNLFEAIARWDRIKLIWGSWRGHDYFHEGGDPMFVLPIVDMATFRWDILASSDFNLMLESTSYFIGNNDFGYGHDMKTALHLQCSWQFSIPVVEWTSPAASPEGAPIPARWDSGL
jgi:hypothetical protein